MASLHVCRYGKYICLLQKWQLPILSEIPAAIAESLDLSLSLFLSPRATGNPGIRPKFLAAHGATGSHFKLPRRYLRTQSRSQRRLRCRAMPTSQPTAQMGQLGCPSPLMLRVPLGHLNSFRALLHVAAPL